MRQIPQLQFELERGGIVANLIVELFQMILGRLNADDQVERFRSIFAFECQHFQAGLAACEGVAALVGQAGHHLSDGGQPFGLQGLLLGLFQGRDVLADGQDGGPSS